MGTRSKRTNHGRDPKKPTELEAVRVTIVGGRPPGSGRSWGAIPRGIEVLVKKASIDPAFRRILLERRAEAAREIDLELDRAEAMMLEAVPAAQLEAVIDRTEVDVHSRAAFLGRAAALMLAALGAGPAAVAAEDEAAGPTDAAPKNIEAPKKTPAAKMARPGDKKAADKNAKPAVAAQEDATTDTAKQSAKPLKRPSRFEQTRGIGPDPPPTFGITPDPPTTDTLTRVRHWRHYK